MTSPLPRIEVGLRGTRLIERRPLEEPNTLRGRVVIWDPVPPKSMTTWWPVVPLAGHVNWACDGPTPVLLERHLETR